MTAGFWSARASLQHVLALARARRVGPWAVLGVALARAVATIPPEVTLPRTIGGRMSLNLFIALVGPSGGGKGAATAAAMEGFAFTGTPAPVVPLGSGEGIARTFRPPGTKPDEPNPVSAAIFDCPEVDSWAALAARTGSTLSAESRKVCSGEALGFANAGKDTRNIVTAGSYRACEIVGVQPLRAHALLGTVADGTPQRFCWLPTSDPDAPDRAPADPGVWLVDTPSWLRATGRPVDLVVPTVATTSIRTHRLAVLREDSAVDPIDGHALLTRLKVAAALMALDGRTVVDPTDWTLAGYVMDVSTHTRDGCRRALVEQSRRANTAAALASADRDEIISDRKLHRCTDGILRALSRLPENHLVAHHQLRRGLKSDVRDYFDAAIAELVADGRVTASRTPKGIGYARPPVDHSSTPPDEEKLGWTGSPRWTAKRWDDSNREERLTRMRACVTWRVTEGELVAAIAPSCGHMRLCLGLRFCERTVWGVPTYCLLS